MRQWTAAKRENPGRAAVLPHGNFYELFYDDAVTAAGGCKWTLDGARPGAGAADVRGAYHAVESYLTRLLRKGYRIALCDQMEDPKLTKKDRPA